MTDPLCRRHVQGDDPIGRSCSACGHQDALHPGFPNPRLDACALCLLDVLARVVLNRVSSEPPAIAPPLDLSATDDAEESP